MKTMAKDETNNSLIVAPAETNDASQVEERLPLKAVKRPKSYNLELLRGKDARDHISKLRRLLYFYKNYETRIELNRGDVLLANFEFECGNELRGNHYVVVLVNSRETNQVVTVVPLKSAKGKALNPASDIFIGKIKGLKSEKETVAVINQIKTIDKSRLFINENLGNIKFRFPKDGIASFEQIIIEKARIYRLSQKQFKKVHDATTQYIVSGYIKH